MKCIQSEFKCIQVGNSLIFWPVSERKSLARTTHKQGGSSLSPNVSSCNEVWSKTMTDCIGVYCSWALWTPGIANSGVHRITVEIRGDQRSMWLNAGVPTATHSFVCKAFLFITTSLLISLRSCVLTGPMNKGIRTSVQKHVIVIEELRSKSPTTQWILIDN